MSCLGYIVDVPVVPLAAAVDIDQAHAAGYDARGSCLGFVQISDVHPAIDIDHSHTPARLALDPCVA